MAVYVDKLEAGHTGRVLIEGREPSGPWQWSECTGVGNDDRMGVDLRDGLPFRIPADRCHDPVNRDARLGPDRTAEVLEHLRQARAALVGLPSGHRQNYEAHASLDRSMAIVRSIAAGVCTAADAEETDRG